MIKYKNGKESESTPWQIIGNDTLFYFTFKSCLFSHRVSRLLKKKNQKQKKIDFFEKNQLRGEKIRLMICWARVSRNITADNQSRIYTRIK